MHKLIIEDDEGRTTVVPLVRDELTIGRREGNAIRLTERNVSRRHARLFKKNGDICIEDFGSYTGVRVNGARILAPVVLGDADQVQIGDYKLSVRAEVAAGEGISLAVTNPALPAAPPPPSAGVPVPAPAAATVPEQLTAAPAPGPPPVHLDAAPTIPLRTLEEQGRVPEIAAGIRPSPPPRLVVVTTDLAGLEFRLDRPSLVIGRTDENDIILNHASISRHHAKVVRDGDRVTVVDLQSANGVRVSGESYERVDVQPGDVLELGHVKLRLVGPLEDWSFAPQDGVSRSRVRLKVAAAAAGVLLAGGLVFALQSKKEAPRAPVQVIAAAPKVPSGPTAATLFAEATAAVATEDWDKAVTALDMLLSRPAADSDAAPVRARALELKGKVDFERRSADIFASFQQAVTGKEPDVALSRYEQIPAESVYKGRAEPALAEVKTLFVAAHLDLADSARTQGHCDEAAAEAEKVQQVDAENRQARDIVRRCKTRPPVRAAAAAPAAAPPPPADAPAGGDRPATPTASALRPVALPNSVLQPDARPTVAAIKSAGARPAARAVRPAAVPARSVVATNTAGETASAPALGGGGDEAQPDATELIRQAREAWLHQQCGSAIELSRRALKLRPGVNDAHQIIAVCACSTKDKEGAIRSYNRLDERSRSMVRTLCARNGVELSE